MSNGLFEGEDIEKDFKKAVGKSSNPSDDIDKNLSQEDKEVFTLNDK